LIPAKKNYRNTQILIFTEPTPDKDFAVFTIMDNHLHINKHLLIGELLRQEAGIQAG
jgi:hypothetical protein